MNFTAKSRGLNGTRKMPYITGLLKFVHLLSISAWMGMLIFFSFFAAPSIFKVLPRETAGDVVGDIFPKYWAVGYVSGISALGSLVALSYIGNEAPLARIILLAFMTVVTFYSGLVVGKRAREVKARIRSAGDEGRKEELRRVFRTLHARSAVLNLIVILAGLALIFLTALTLRT